MIAEPKQLADAFVEAWNDHDPDALADLFTADADFVNVVGLWWRDRAGIRGAHAYGFERIFGQSRMTLRRRRVRRLGEVAVVVAQWSLTGQLSPAGEPAGERRGVLTLVGRRGQDGWRTVSAHNTDTVPGVETHVARDGGLDPTDYREPREGGSR